MSRHAGRDDAEEQGRTECRQRRHRRRPSRHQELHLTSAQQPLVERVRVLVQQGPLPGRERRRPHRTDRPFPRRRDPLHRRCRPEKRQRANHRQLPRRRENDRRDEREGEEDQE
jgi:hypothetical protein